MAGVLANAQTAVTDCVCCGVAGNIQMLEHTLCLELSRQ